MAAAGISGAVGLDTTVIGIPVVLTPVVVGAVDEVIVDTFVAGLRIRIIIKTVLLTVRINGRIAIIDTRECGGGARASWVHVQSVARAFLDTRS